MRKSKTLYLIVQLISWGLLCTIIGLAAFLQEEFSLRTALKLGLIYALLLLFSHFMREIFIRRDWLNLKIGPLVPRVFSLSFSLSLLLMLIINMFNFFIYQETFLSVSEFFINTLLYTLFLIMWSAIYLTYHLLQKSRQQEINNLKLQASQTQNELKTLRDQLNPHFLFNSLNSIRALIEVDPSTAKSAITTLSSLLRKSLLLGKKLNITLKEEIGLVEEYLKLEKIRFEERLNYTIENTVLTTIQIPPFLMQSMVENAIKHGISKKAKGGTIHIKTEFKGQQLTMTIINDGEYKPKESQGIGLENTKRRLEIIYGDQSSLTIENKNNKVFTQIWINIKKNNNESSNHRR